MTLAATARFACISLRPARQAPPPVAAQRTGRFPRAVPYGDFRHTPHGHGAFCVHEPAPGARKASPFQAQRESPALR